MAANTTSAKTKIRNQRVAAFGQLVRNLLDVEREAICVLYERNIPAQRFVRRLGFTTSGAPITHPDNGLSGLVFTRPTSCRSEACLR